MRFNLAVLLWLLAQVADAVAVEAAISDDAPPRCVPITNSFCSNLGYNYTVENPKLNGDLTQGEIVTDLQYWQSLLQSGCSKYLQQFICAAYNPICEPGQAHFGPIGPCKRICDHVRKYCEPLLLSFISSGWPSRLSCDQFVATNKANSFCMDFVINEELNKSLVVTLYPRDREPNTVAPQRNESPETQQPLQHDANSLSASYMSRTLCAVHSRPDNFVYVNRSDRCALRCDRHLLFNEDEKNVAQNWAVVMSSICFVCTLVTVVTIVTCIRQGRFRFPQRPVVLLAGCYCALSLAYLIRFFAGREAVACTAEPSSQRKYLALEGLDNAWCSLVFLLSYFFGLAAATWWCLLTVSLALATAWHKSHDCIKHYASYFYMVGFGAPAVITIVVLVLRWVDADELLGMCYVGNQNSAALLYLLIVPHSLLLLVGTVFLVVGFSAQMHAKRRCAEPQQSAQGALALRSKEKLEVATMKICIYSLIGFILPGVCVIACNIYEYMHFDEWHTPASKARPAIELFMLRLLMLFTGGITTVIFIWSRKTLQAWRAAFAKLCCFASQLDKSAQAAPLPHLTPVPRPLLQLHNTRTCSQGGSSTSHHEYELLQQDEQMRRSGREFQHPCLTHPHSSSSGSANLPRMSANTLLPSDYFSANQQMFVSNSPFASPVDNTPPDFAMMQVTSDPAMQFAPALYRPAVHQPVMLNHNMSSNDQLKASPPLVEPPDVDWPMQPVTNTHKVVAPPPSLVNVQLINNSYYVPQLTHGVPPVFTDGRRLPQHTPAFSAYKTVRHEAAF